MDEATTSEDHADIVEANLDAMGVLNVESRRILSDTRVPECVQATTGRDGVKTYTWQADDGSLQWLGRSTMPGVRAAALIDTFKLGSGNVLLDGFGTGVEAELLLKRLALHQAVIVLEESAWQAALVLRLYDFSQDLRAGRLLVFPGEDRWGSFRSFLLSHPGYLTPDRVLGWPWYGPEEVSKVSERLAEVATSVARERVALRAGGCGSAPVAEGERSGVAVVSNSPSLDVIDLSLRLEAGAEELGIPCVRCVLDDPGCVHPDAVRSMLHAARAGALVLLDVLPDGLPYDIPDGPLTVLWTHRAAPTSEWLRRLPSRAKLAVLTPKIREDAIARGAELDQVRVLPPAAVGAVLEPATGVSARRRVLVYAPGGNVSPSAAGLHLGSHRRLWEVSGEIIRERVESYCDQDASEVLREAQRRLKIKIEDQEVEAGLADRIRHLLGPVSLRCSCIGVIRKAGLDFDVYGGGWGGDSEIGSHDRGRWPSPADLPVCLSGYGLAVFVEPSGCVTSAMLDCMAAGVPCVVRSHAKDATANGLAAVIDPERHVSRFETQKQLQQILLRYKSEPMSFADQARRAAGHVRGKHTWGHRIEAILGF